MYSSNALALLGLRSLYVVLDPIGKLRHLHYGLAAVLAFAALKLVIPDWIDIPPLIGGDHRRLYRRLALGEPPRTPERGAPAAHVLADLRNTSRPVMRGWSPDQVPDRRRA